MMLLLLPLLRLVSGLRCHGDVAGDVDECRLGTTGFHGLATSRAYHPGKTSFEQEVCTKSLVRNNDGAWEMRRGCAKRTMAHDFEAFGGLCYYNTPELYYNWFVTCTCATEMCNGDTWASAAMVPEQRYAVTPTEDPATAHNRVSAQNPQPTQEAPPPFEEPSSGGGEPEPEQETSETDNQDAKHQVDEYGPDESEDGDSGYPADEYPPPGDEEEADYPEDDDETDTPAPEPSSEPETTVAAAGQLRAGLLILGSVLVITF